MTSLTTTPQAEALECIGRDYAALHEAEVPGWLGSLRRGGWERFRQLGLPTTRQEAWRYTSLAPITAHAFALAPSCPLDGTVLHDRIHGGAERLRLVFVNGHAAPELSALQGLPPGVRFESLARLRREAPGLVEPYLGRLAETSTASFAALNTAFLDDGAVLLVDDGVVVESPIHLVFVSADADGPRVSHQRVLVVAGRSSQLTVVESYAGVGSAPALSNAVSEIFVGANAVVDHYRLLAEPESSCHVASTWALQERSSRFVNHSLALGGSLVRSDIESRLAGEGAECTLNGLYVVRGRQHVDHHTRIHHLEPHCTSQELYKGVLDERATAVFDGTILVVRDAQKTHAQQTNQNLLLSDDAVVNSKPLLEINADDVKCAHGSTVGQLDKEALFYLQSRGIDRDAATQLLVRAFVEELVERVRVPSLSRTLSGLLEARLPGRSADEGGLA